MLPPEDPPQGATAPRTNRALDRLSRMFHTGGGSRTGGATSQEGVRHNSMFGTANPGHLQPMTLQRNSTLAVGAGGDSSFSRWPSGLSGKGTSVSGGQVGASRRSLEAPTPGCGTPMGSPPQSPKAVRIASAPIGIAQQQQRSKLYVTSPGDVEMGHRVSSWDDLRAAAGGASVLPVASSGGRGRRSSVDESSFSALSRPAVGGSFHHVGPQAGVGRVSLERLPASPSRLARLSVLALGPADGDSLQSLRTSMHTASGGSPAVDVAADNSASVSSRRPVAQDLVAHSGSSEGNVRPLIRPSRSRAGASSTGRRPLLALSSSEDETTTSALEERRLSKLSPLGAETATMVQTHAPSVPAGPQWVETPAESPRPLTAGLSSSHIARRAMSRAMVLSMPPVDNVASLPLPDASLPAVTPSAQGRHRGVGPSPSPLSSNGSLGSTISKRRALLSQPLSDSD